MNIRLLLPGLLLVAFAIPAVHAQTTPPQTTLCSNYFCANGSSVSDTPNVAGDWSLAAGASAQTTSSEATAIGSQAQAGNGQTLDATGMPAPGGQTAIGFLSRAVAQGATSVGWSSAATGQLSTALGTSATAGADYTTAVGSGANASGDYGSAFGISAQASGQFSLAAGNNAQAQALYSTSVGSASYVTSDAVGSTALGFASSAQASDCTAIGNGATCTKSATVSFGSLGYDYTLQHVAPGMLSNDAVNVGQLNQGLSYLGAGAGLNNGVFTAPGYALAGGTFNNVGDALTYLDNKPAGQVENGSSAHVTAGKNITVTQDASGNSVVATSDTPTFSSVTTTSGGSTTVTSGNGVTIAGTGNAVSLTSAGLDNGDHTISGVAPGEVSAASSQAINGSQLFNAENWAKSYMDRQIHALNNRIDDLGATAAASAALASNYLPTPNSFSAGVGFQGGRNAIAIGYRHVSESRRVSLSIQGAVGGSERSVGVGVGYGW